MNENITFLRQLAVGRTLEERMTNAETQVDLHSSLMNSEAGTRMRSHQLLHARMDKQDQRLIRIERAVYAVGGAIYALKLLPDLIKLFHS